MATEMTYSSLVKDLQRYLERGSSAAADPLVFDQIPRLINNAERNIARELKIQGFLVVANSALQTGVSSYAKPDRWRATVSMNIVYPYGGTNRVPLFPRVYEYLRMFAPDESVTSTPQFYADYDFSHWLISPIPDQNYSLEVIYYEQPQLLDETNQSNWLTEYAPTMLLYAALLEATPFLKDDARIPTWQAAYDRAKTGVEAEDLKRVTDRTVTRDKP